MYNNDALLNGIEKCKENIKVFEDAIQKERDTIQEYHTMMEAIDKNARIQKKQKELASRIEIDNGS